MSNFCPVSQWLEGSDEVTGQEASKLHTQEAQVKFTSTYPQVSLQLPLTAFQG